MAQESRNPQFSAGDGSAAAQQQSPQQSVVTPAAGPRPCPQDCSRCPVSQQVYCSTKMLFDLSRAHQETSRQLAAVTAAIADIQAQLHPKDGAAPLSTPIIETT